MHRRLLFTIAIPLLSIYALAQDSGDSAGTELSAEEIRIRKLLNLPIPGQQVVQPQEKQGESKQLEQDQIDALVAGLQGSWLTQSSWFLNHAAEVSAGYQRNVLKDNPGKVNAPFASLLLETSGSFISNRHPVFNFYVVGERKEFSSKQDLPSEDLFLLFTNWSFGRAPTSRFIGEAATFHVRQVLEDPFQQGSASLLSLWSSKLRVGILLSSSDHSLSLGLVGANEKYDEAVLDNASTGLFLRWKWKVNEMVGLQAESEYLVKDFGNRLAREADGLPVKDARLGMERLSVDLQAKCKPPVKWVEAVSASLKFRRDWSDLSLYDRSYLIQLRSSATFIAGRFTFRPQIDGNYLVYDERQTSLFTANKQYKGAWSTSFAVEYAFGENVALEAVYDFGQTKSNRESLVYDEDTVALRLRWEF